MAINIKAELGKITDALAAIASVEKTLKTPRHINDVVKTSYKVTTDEFIKDITQQAVANPKRFSHMYEWGQTGDPNSRLWKHVLSGTGRSRISTFQFKASKKIVPVHPALAKVGVQKRHIFYWKAPVFEYGLPVTISPKVAKYLVYLDSKVKNPRSGFRGFKRGGVVYRESPVHIEHAGGVENRGAFTRAYTEWWEGSSPGTIIEKTFNESTKSIGKVLDEQFSRINRKKSFRITPVAYDATVGEKLQRALKNQYAKQSLNRLVSDG